MSMHPSLSCSLYQVHSSWYGYLIRVCLLLQYRTSKKNLFQQQKPSVRHSTSVFMCLYTHKKGNVLLTYQRIFLEVLLALGQKFPLPKDISRLHYLKCFVLFYNFGDRMFFLDFLERNLHPEITLFSFFNL